MAEKNDKELKALMEASGQGDKHNWMYAFMNRTNTLYPFSDLASAVDTIIYLVAYCKQCDQTATVQAPLSSDGTPRLNRAGIPKYGCDWGEVKKA